MSTYKLSKLTGKVTEGIIEKGGMKQITKHNVNRLSVVKLREMAPFEITDDGEAVLVVYDVNKLDGKPKASHDVNKLTELPYSKGRQAKSNW